MREILFKAKRIDNGEWVYGTLVKRPSAIQIVSGTYSAWYINRPPCDPDDIGDYCNIYPETVCQYTGMKDKNGKKIFENDILLIEFEFDREPELGGPTKWYEPASVFFSDKHLAWFVKFNDGDDYYLNEYIDDDCITVIGNICDNKGVD